MYKPSASDLKNGVYVAKIKINNKEYVLNAPANLPKDYEEDSFENGCSIYFPLDLSRVEVNINSGDLKKGETVLEVSAGKKGSNYDDFFIDRIEIAGNEKESESTLAHLPFSKRSGDWLPGGDYEFGPTSRGPC